METSEHRGKRAGSHSGGLWGVGPDWRHQHMLVHCDSMAVVQVIMAQSSKDRTLMHLLRCIQFFCAVGDFKLRVAHIPGFTNTPADAASRNHLQVFSMWPPGAQASHPNSGPTVEFPDKSATGVELACLEGMAENLIADSLVPSFRWGLQGWPGMELMQF